VNHLSHVLKQERNEGLVLDDEDGATSAAGALHGYPGGRQLGAIAKATGSPQNGPQGPKPSINPLRVRNTCTDRLR
jgi:hypothetical protein